MKFKCQSKHLQGDLFVQVNFTPVVATNQTMQPAPGMSTLQLSLTKDEAKRYEIGEEYSVEVVAIEKEPIRRSE